MTHLLPQATSWASKLLGITGLDIRPYRWSVVTETGQWRGELTVEYLARGARLDIDAMRYRMQRRTRGLRETEFTLMAASGEELASATQGVRGRMTRETTMRVAGKAFTLSGTREQLALLSADDLAAGSLQIERSGWTIRQSHGYLHFDDSGIGEAAQVFLFWISIHQDLKPSDAGG
jgi:hypothetical protein